MTVSFRAASQIPLTSAATTQLTLIEPAGAAAGDVMIAQTMAQTTAVSFTPPDGWTQIGTTKTVTNGSQRLVEALWWIRRGASAPPLTWTLSASGVGRRGSMVAYSSNVGFRAASPIAASARTVDADFGDIITHPSTTPPAAGLAVRHGAIQWTTRTFGSFAPSGHTERLDGGGAQLALVIGDSAVAKDTPSGTATSDVAGTTDGGVRVASTTVLADNFAPAAPPLQDPVSSKVIDRAAAYTFLWLFTDPDAGDVQSAYELRYKIAGGAFVSTGKVTSSAAQRVIAGGTFAAGTYEWQVRTYDAADLEGPWSPSSFFVAADKPVAPTITAPTGGATISASTGTVTITHPGAPSQARFRVRSADGSVTHYDSGTIAYTTSHVAQYPPASNGTTVLTEAQVAQDGIWSNWASVSNPVVYTPPAQAILTVTAITGGALEIDVVNETPTGEEPAAVSVELERQQYIAGAWRSHDAGMAGSLYRIAADLPPNGSHVDRTVAHRGRYRYRATTLGDNGSSSVSDWAGDTTGVGGDTGFPYTLPLTFGGGGATTSGESSSYPYTYPYTLS